MPLLTWVGFWGGKGRPVTGAMLVKERWRARQDTGAQWNIIATAHALREGFCRAIRTRGGVIYPRRAEVAESP